MAGEESSQEKQLPISDRRKISRREFLRNLLQVGIAGVLPAAKWAVRLATEKEAKEDHFDKSLKELFPRAKIREVADFFWPQGAQLVTIDSGAPLVKEFIQRGRELVGDASGTAAVERLTSFVYKNISSNEKETIGFQSLSEEIIEGGGCLGRSVLLTVLIEDILPEVHPRIAVAFLGTELSLDEISDDTGDGISLGDRFRKLITGGFAHAFVVFEGNEGQVMVAEPYAGSVHSYEEYRQLQGGIRAGEFFRWQPSENK